MKTLDTQRRTILLTHHSNVEIEWATMADERANRMYDLISAILGDQLTRSPIETRLKILSVINEQIMLDRNTATVKIRE